MPHADQRTKRIHDADLPATPRQLTGTSAIRRTISANDHLLPSCFTTHDQ